MVGIKQETMSECVKCVAAMATGTTLQEARAEMGAYPDGSCDDFDFMVYCVKRGVLPGGAPYEFDGKLPDYVDFTAMQKMPAYVFVKSERLPGKSHAIYWDGNQVFDPNPIAQDGRPITDYEVLGWWPLFKMTDGCQKQVLAAIDGGPKSNN
jgi:hypothetical protein